MFDAADRRLLKLAVPVFFTLIAEPLYILVDTAIVGRISTAALGGLALAGSVLVAVSWIFGFLATGVTTQVGQRLGAGDRAGAADAVAQGAWVAFGLSVIVTSAVFVFGNWMLRAIGGKGDVLDNASTYLRISAFGIPAILFTFLALGWLRGTSNMRTPLIVAVGANIANVLIELFFVFGLDLGIAGSAWGTVIVQWGSVICLATVVRRDVSIQPLRPSALRGLLTIGGAMVLRTGSMIATITAATSVAARGGKQTLGAHQITIQTFTFLAFAIDALAISTQTVFAEELGRGDVSGLAPLTKRLVRLGAIAGLTLGLGLAVASPWLPALFSPDREVQRQARIALVLLCVMQVSGAIVFTLDGILMGSNRFGRLALVAVCAGGAFIGAVSLASVFFSSRILQVWIGMNSWMLVRLIGNSLVARASFRSLATPTPTRR